MRPEQMTGAVRSDPGSQGYLYIKQMRSSANKPHRSLLDAHLRGLKLGKLHRIVRVVDTNAARGMLTQVSHLVRIMQEQDPSLEPERINRARERAADLRWHQWRRAGFASAAESCVRPVGRGHASPEGGLPPHTSLALAYRHLDQAVLDFRRAREVGDLDKLVMNAGYILWHSSGLSEMQALSSDVYSNVAIAARALYGMIFSDNEEIAHQAAYRLIAGSPALQRGLNPQRPFMELAPEEQAVFRQRLVELLQHQHVRWRTSMTAKPVEISANNGMIVDVNIDLDDALSFKVAGRPVRLAGLSGLKINLAEMSIGCAIAEERVRNRVVLARGDDAGRLPLHASARFRFTPDRGILDRIPVSLMIPGMPQEFREVRIAPASASALAFA